MKGPALAVMAKAPFPSHVKTRLEPDLNATQCAELSLAFLKDAIALASVLPDFTPFLAFSPSNERSYFQMLITKNMKILPQTGEDLGERMYRLMAELEHDGYEPVILIGTDIPTLQPDAVTQAFKELEQADLCLGPSCDGGYYLIGAHVANQNVFRNVDWGTSNVLEQTMKQAKDAGLSVAFLEEYEDVDVFDDLKRLNSEIENLNLQQDKRIPKHTRQWLRQNENLFK